MANIQEIEGIKNLLPETPEQLSGYVLIDVRREDEFNGELGHIEGAELKTLGEELTEFLQSANKSANYLFICRSGGRSTNACRQALELGFSDCTNLNGGMMKWNELGLPVV